jgi:hypothetical protein
MPDAGVVDLRTALDQFRLDFIQRSAADGKVGVGLGQAGCFGGKRQASNGKEGKEVFLMACPIAGGTFQRLQAVGAGRRLLNRANRALAGPPRRLGPR